MELVCPYCSAKVAGLPPDGACPVCGESLAGLEPSVPEAPIPPVPVSTSVGVVPLGAEEMAPTHASAPAPTASVSEPPVELARELEPSVVEPSVVEDTVVSGMQMLAPEPEAQPSWDGADVEGQAAAAFAGWSAPGNETRAQAALAAPSAPETAKRGIPGLAEFLALVQNGARPGSSGARERECPSCHSRVIAAADELCPNCGDLLDGSGESPAAGNGMSAEAPAPVTATTAPAVPVATRSPAPPPTPVAEALMPETTVSRAQERECPHCHAIVFAAPDELCPTCGDLLDAPPNSPGASSEEAAAPYEDTAVSESPGAMPEPEARSGAALRECPHCHSHVFATEDELCPECGDLLEGAALVEDSQAAAAAIEERDCGHCGARVVGTPGIPCPACGEVLGAPAEVAAALPGLRPAPNAESSSTLDEETFVGPGAAAPVVHPDDEKTVVELPPPAPAPVAAPVAVPPAAMAAAAAPVAAADAPLPTKRATLSERPALPSPPARPRAATKPPAVSPRAEPSTEPTVADAADGGEPTVADPMASEAELVLGEDPGTSAREERFPSPKVPRSREQVSLPGRKPKAAAPKAEPKPSPSPSPAPAPATAASPAPEKAPDPPWQAPAENPVKISPVRATAAPPSIVAARGAAAAPLPAPRRGRGLLLGLTFAGLAAVAAGAVFVFGFGGKLPGSTELAVATPTPVPESSAAETATPVAMETAGSDSTATPDPSATPHVNVAPTPVARMSEVAASTPIVAPTRFRPTPAPQNTARMPAPTRTPFVAATPPPTPVVARTPVVVTPPPPVATPTAVVIATPPPATPPPATPPPATPPPATPAPTKVASVDPRFAAAVAQVKTADPDTISTGVKTLKRLVKEDPSFADAWFWLGAGYGRIEENDDACDAFRKYMKLAPNGGYAPQARVTVKACDQ